MGLGVVADGARGVTGDGGSVVVFVSGCFGAAGPGCLSKIVLPTPVWRVAMMERDNEVIMNKIADTVVAFESSVADPFLDGPPHLLEPN